MVRFVILIFILGTLSLLLFLKNPGPQVGGVSQEPEVSIDARIFFDEPLFWQGIATAKRNSPSFKKDIAGGVVPHHSVASNLLSDFFLALSNQKPDTILLLGPNHKEKGSFSLLTSNRPWVTPFGTVEADKDTITTLIRGDVVRVDNDVLPEEHSIGTLLPYIKYYVPETEIIPLVVSNRMTLEEALKRSESIRRVLARKGVVVIASIDFSHNLFYQESLAMDMTTELLIRRRDYRSLVGLGNDHLDAPMALVMLMDMMDNVDKKNLEIVKHSSSAEQLNRFSEPTTTYYTMVFY